MVVTSAASVAATNGTIVCSDDSCSPDFPVSENISKNSHNSIVIENNGKDLIEVKSEPSKRPRDVKLIIENREFPDSRSSSGKSIKIDLSSRSQTNDSASVVLLGDNFKEIDVKLSGYSGSSGKNASTICADNLKAGLYGTNVKDFFLEARLNDSSISDGFCGVEDINFMQQNKFECPAGFNEVTTSNSIYSVNVSRIPRINRCQTAISYNVCIKRIVELTCKWGLFTSSGTYLNRDATIVGEMPENRYYQLKNTMSNSQICDNFVARDITDPSYVPPTSELNPYLTNPNSVAGCAPGPCEWRVNGAVSVKLTTPGLQEDGSLHPSSKWSLISKAPGEVCNSSATTSPIGSDPGDPNDNGFWSALKTVTVNYVAYDRVSTDDVSQPKCSPNNLVTFSGGSIITSYPALALDPLKHATWFYTGQTQEPDFGTQVIQCELGSCPVSSSVSEVNKSIDTISPGSGESGTTNGGGHILVYSAESIKLENKMGIAGPGGRNDLPNNSSTRVCSKIRDSDSDGISSDYARNPYVSFNRYNWTSIKTNSSGNPGFQPVSSGKSISVWKKLDTSSRQVIKDILFD